MILCFVYHAPYLANQEFLKKVNFSKTKGFSSWFKINDKVSKHLSCGETCDEKNISNYSKHSLMMTKAEGLIQRFQNPTATIPYNFDATREIQISKNREIFKWVMKTIVLCGKQCIALHGYREDIHNSSNNCGNSLAILKLLSEKTSDLKHHLDAPFARNATTYSLVFKIS